MAGTSAEIRIPANNIAKVKAGRARGEACHLMLYYMDEYYMDDTTPGQWIKIVDIWPHTNSALKIYAPDALRARPEDWGFKCECLEIMNGSGPIEVRIERLEGMNGSRFSIYDGPDINSHVDVTIINPVERALR
jgi:hypothetical protein